MKLISPKNISILLVLIGHGLFSCYGQGGFRKTYLLQNSLGSVCGNAVEGPNGNLVMIGITKDTINNAVFSRLTIVGTDPNGTILWRKDYGSSKFEYLSVAKSVQNNSSIFQVLSVRDSANNFFSVLLKLNYNGDTLLQRKYYSSVLNSRLYAQGISLSIDNGFLITGFESNINQPDEPLLVMKTDASGNELWRKILNKTIPNINRGYEILQDTQTKKIVVSGLQYIGSATNSDTYSNIVILDSLGVKIFQTSFNNAGGSGMGGLIQLKDKNFIIGGSWYVKSSGQQPYYNAYLVKFGITGNIIWKKQYNNLAPYNSIVSINESENGKLVLLGKNDTTTFINLQFIQADENGVIFRQRNIGHAYDEESSEGYNNYTLTKNKGYLVSTAFPYLQTEHPYSIIKTDSTGCDTTEAYCKSIEVGVDKLSDLAGFNFELYPNPANDMLKIKIDAPWNKNFKVTLSDIAGRLIETLILESNNYNQFNTASYSSGIYFATVYYNGKTVETKKVVIIH